MIASLHQPRTGRMYIVVGMVSRKTYLIGHYEYIYLFIISFFKEEESFFSYFLGPDYDITHRYNITDFGNHTQFIETDAWINSHIQPIVTTHKGIRSMIRGSRRESDTAHFGHTNDSL